MTDSQAQSTEALPSDFDDYDEKDASEAQENHTQAAIVQTMPLWREILFIVVISSSQLYTQAAVGQVMSILYIIGDTWNMPYSHLSWFLAGYSLTLGTFVIFAGRLGDMFGYKPLFMIGMTWFALWTLICGVSVYSNDVLFIFSRVFQGIGPAIVLPNGLALLGASYAPGRRKTIAFAAFTATGPAGNYLGALFSGIFSRAWWPWTFFCCAMIMTGTTILAYFVIPPVPPMHRDNRPNTVRGKLIELDLPGAAAGITGLVLFNFAWNQAPLVGWEQAYVYVCLILGILFFSLYVIIDLKFAPVPLIPWKALTLDTTFILGALACGWASFGVWSWYCWLFVLDSRALEALIASGYCFPIVTSGTIAALATGSLMQRVGPQVLMTAGLVAFAVGSILIATCPVGQMFWKQIFCCYVIIPWGMDLTLSSANLMLSNAVALEYQGIAAGMTSTVVNYSIALGVGIGGTIESHTNRGGATAEDSPAHLKR
ncbi:multidrug-resistance type transporter aminotriazole resistance [Cytospora paraplurivora]|uniref:Multidrug-resistance type transporter aminotriazole resistance n=1 Tax=Cytospora paraplurivora TaxID=2898453 RepID=A0AAN9YFN6_9PEZI